MTANQAKYKIKLGKGKYTINTGQGRGVNGTPPRYQPAAVS